MVTLIHGELLRLVLIHGEEDIHPLVMEDTHRLLTLEEIRIHGRHPPMVMGTPPQCMQNMDTMVGIPTIAQRLAMEILFQVLNQLHLLSVFKILQLYLLSVFEFLMYPRLSIRELRLLFD
jgi:hypothetical protein